VSPIESMGEVEEGEGEMLPAEGMVEERGVRRGPRKGGSYEQAGREGKLCS
jgi:hypothetical protein